LSNVLTDLKPNLPVLQADEYRAQMAAAAREAEQQQQQQARPAATLGDAIAAAQQGQQQAQQAPQQVHKGPPAWNLEQQARAQAPSLKEVMTFEERQAQQQAQQQAQRPQGAVAPRPGAAVWGAQPAPPVVKSVQVRARDSALSGGKYTNCTSLFFSQLLFPTTKPFYIELH
jgi:hypothetical protein